MKAKRIKVTGCAIPGLFIKGRVHECIEGLPEDAKFLRAWFEPSNDCFSLIFESESFEEVEEGNEIPIFMPEFKRHAFSILPKRYEIYVCRKCGMQLKEEQIGEKCPACGAWTYYQDCRKEITL